MTNSSCKDCNSEDPFISAEKQIEEEEKKEKLIEKYTKNNIMNIMIGKRRKLKKQQKYATI